MATSEARLSDAALDRPRLPVIMTGMGLLFRSLLLLSTVTSVASTQAVSEWRTASGVPVAIVETPAGDLEHIAALVPADAAAPPRLLGFPTKIRAVAAAQVLEVAVPANLAAIACSELASFLKGSGTAAVVAVGPVAVRELSGPLGLLEAAPWRPPSSVPCAVADGAVETVRGAPERVELAFAAPGLAEQKAELLPAVAVWLENGLGLSEPGTRVELLREGGCQKLVARRDATDADLVEQAHRLREALRRAATRVPSESELAEIEARLSRRALRWAVDSGALAGELVERIAAGGRASAALAPPLLVPATVSEIARELIGGRAGALRIYEMERRPLGEDRRTLANGLLVSWRWVSGNGAMMAVALGGVEDGVAREALSALASAAAGRGWLGQVTDVLGTPSVAFVVPAEDLVDALELAAAVLVKPSAPEGLRHEESVVDLGLAPSLSAETISLALALPERAEEALEAVDKFYTAIASRGVHSEALAAGAPLRWTQTEAPARIAAVVPLPLDGGGLVAGQLLLERLPKDPDITARWLTSPGRAALVVVAVGAGDVPTLDGRLAKVWEEARRMPSAAEVQRAAGSLAKALYGDALVTMARSAATPFLATVPSTEMLLAAETSEAGAALAGLPAWRDLRRDARGPAPQQLHDVRESRPRPRRRS